MYSLDQCSLGASQVLRMQGKPGPAACKDHPLNRGRLASASLWKSSLLPLGSTSPRSGTDLGRGFAVLTSKSVPSPSTPAQGSHMSLDGDMHGHKSNMAPCWGPMGLGWMQSSCESYIQETG